MPPANTEATVIRCQLGEREAFTDLVDEWNESLNRYIRALTSNPDQVDDLVQEVWIRVIRGLMKLRDPARFPPWLFTVARRTFADQLRSDYRDPILHSLSGAETAAEVTEDLEVTLDMEGSIERLPPIDAEAVLLHHVSGFSLAEIAEIADVPIGTVKSRLHRGRQQLRDLLGQGEDQE